MNIISPLLTPVLRKLTASILDAINGGSPAFTPASLFGASDTGGWWDLDDDMDTKLQWCIDNPGYTNASFRAQFPNHALFQDSAGTTPVTAVEQPLGMVLDKSKGLVLGAELVDTANDFTAWVVPANNTKDGDDGAVHITYVDNASGGHVYLTGVSGLSSDMVVGKTYRVSMKVKVSSGGSVQVRSMFATTGTVYIVTSTTYIEYISYQTVTNNTNYISVTLLDAGEEVWIKDISVKEIAGNHRTQATTGSKPKWSARKNLLTYTEDFSNAVWGVFNGTKLGNTVIDGVPCTEVSFDATLGASIEQNLAAIGVIQTLNVRVRAKTTPIKLRVLFGGNDAGATVDIPLAWTDLQGTANGTANANAVAVRNGETVAKSFYIARAQCEYGSTATTYQSVVTATDYNAIGFPKGCKYDGVDDGMATASIDFTATDKMSVCAGVQKLSDAAIGCVVELSNGSTGLNAFRLQWPSATGVNIGFSSGGSISTYASVAGPASPSSSVLTGLGDISGDSTLLRRNGVVGATNTGDQGTGNYGNTPLYFGRRGGTSQPFTGQENQSFVINRILTAPELTQLEQFIATKSGVVLP